MLNCDALVLYIEIQVDKIKKTIFSSVNILNEKYQINNFLKAFLCYLKI